MFLGRPSGCHILENVIFQEHIQNQETDSGTRPGSPAVTFNDDTVLVLGPSSG